MTTTPIPAPLLTPRPAPPLAPATRLPGVWNAPNAVTAVRTVVAVLLGALGVAGGDWRLLAAGYAAYWVGDVADGWVARRLGQETRLGAVLDIVCDRLCTVLLAVGLVALVPATAPAVVVFLLCFAALDTMLSLAFLCWDLLGPNDFWRADRTVWALNWSPAAKTLNTAGVVGALALGAHTVALAVAVVVLGLKAWSVVRVLRLVS